MIMRKKLITIIINLIPITFFSQETTKEIVRADNNGSLTVNKEVLLCRCLLIREL